MPLVNALAPRPQNALISNDPMQALLQKMPAYSSYNDLVDYLMPQGMLPRFKKVETYGSKFTVPGFNDSGVPKQGVIDIGYGGPENSIVHELTHAAQRQMENQYFQLKKKENRSPVEDQFMQAYEKLIYDPGSMFGKKPTYTQAETAKKIDPLWQKSKNTYRGSGEEMAAWGMGSTVSPNLDSPAPLHIDPTMATEFSVLLDLAKRTQRK